MFHLLLRIATFYADSSRAHSGQLHVQEVEKITMVGERNLHAYCLLRAQSFTSVKADLRQDIKGGFAFSRCLNGTFS